jgi:hypothetical protein
MPVFRRFVFWVTASNPAKIRPPQAGRCVAGNRRRADRRPTSFHMVLVRRASSRRDAVSRPPESIRLSTRSSSRRISDSRRCRIGSHGFPAARWSDRTESHPSGGGGASAAANWARSRASPTRLSACRLNLSRFCQSSFAKNGGSLNRGRYQCYYNLTGMG